MRLRCTHLLECTKIRPSTRLFDDRRRRNIRIDSMITETRRIPGILGDLRCHPRRVPTRHPTVSVTGRRNHTRSEACLFRESRRESRQESPGIQYRARTANPKLSRAYRLRGRWNWVDRYKAKTSRAGRRSTTQSVRFDPSNTRIRDTCQSGNATRERWR